MDKDLLKLLERLNEFVEHLDNNTDNDFINNKIKEAFNQPVTLSIEKKENGEANTHIEGNNLAILITLAGLEKSVLSRLNTPTDMWEFIQHIVGVKEGK